jgi:hypothetical protein
LPDEPFPLGGWLEGGLLLSDITFIPHAHLNSCLLLLCAASCQGFMSPLFSLYTSPSGDLLKSSAVYSYVTPKNVNAANRTNVFLIVLPTVLKEVRGSCNH